MLVGGYHLVKVLVLFFELVCLLVKLINVSEQAVILFLRLNESCHYFVDAGYSCRVLNCFECFFYDACVSHVLVEELLFL